MTLPCLCRIIAGLWLVAIFAGAQKQKYSGPRPPKPDLPYLVHADNLVETEPGEAREEQRKDGTAYVTKGPSSLVRTPLAEPVFLFQSETIAPGRLSLFRLQSKGGTREIVFPPPNKRKNDDPSRPRRLILAQLDEGLYRLEANETLDNGEYCLSPSDSNRVFCFQVY